MESLIKTSLLHAYDLQESARNLHNYFLIPIEKFKNIVK